ncbi:hypothetical protein G8A07_15190 [Roseateles sp. DAIF2]|uniref:hypothetical protein n=1 Tax=Roseateles sp. DAIF2 TaxID=2714952 RepID=UPI0018A24F07|nr:hypothetical protein [Roseateles sp. DAIF2]QPF74126.1 hypothetical protein G8A07_15190 [Roseateles sp. DAIF2]
MNDESLPRTGGRRSALALLAALLFGCADGYPDQDAALISPFDMSQSQRLAALNGLGREARGERRGWHYALESGCRLRTELRQRGEDKQTGRHALVSAMEVLLQFDKAARRYELFLTADASEAAPRLARLYDSARWTDAVQARLLLRLLIRDCR